MIYIPEHSYQLKTMTTIVLYRSSLYEIGGILNTNPIVRNNTKVLFSQRGTRNYGWQNPEYAVVKMIDRTGKEKYFVARKMTTSTEEREDYIVGNEVNGTTQELTVLALSNLEDKYWNSFKDEEYEW